LPFSFSGKVTKTGSLTLPLADGDKDKSFGWSSVVRSPKTLAALFKSTLRLDIDDPQSLPNPPNPPTPQFYGVLKRTKCLISRGLLANTRNKPYLR